MGGRTESTYGSEMHIIIFLLFQFRNEYDEDEAEHRIADTSQWECEIAITKGEKKHDGNRAEENENGKLRETEGWLGGGGESAFLRRIFKYT